MKQIKKLLSIYFCVLVLAMQIPISAFAEGESITEPVSVEILHQHTGDSNCEGGCYGTDYHVHEGNSSVCGGCYTVPQYAYHTCNGSLDHGSAEYGYSIVANNGTWYYFTCSSCGRVYGFSDENANSYNRCVEAIISNTISSYGLSCGKTETTIEGISLHCGLNEESVIGTLHINPSADTQIVKQLDLNAYIDGSGATATDYLWNTGETTNTKSVTSNGTYTCTVTYLDYKASFTKDLSIIVKNIDNKAPEINMDLSTGWINKDLEVSINAKDAAESADSICSGLPVEAYSWDNGLTWTSNNSFIFTSSGNYELCVKDNAGNIAKKTFSIQMDKIAPTVNIYASSEWTSKNVVISATATDDVISSVSGGDVSGGDVSGGNTGSGLAAEPFSWDGGSTWTSNNIQEALDNGSYSVMVRDNAGNISTATININCIDKSIPEVVVEKQFENWPYNEDSMLITVNANDNQSGLPTEAYSFDGGSTWSNQNTYTVKNSFCLSIAVRDQVGNIFYQNLDVVKESAPIVSVQAVVKPVEPTPDEPEKQPEPEPEPEVKQTQIEPVTEVRQEEQQLEIIEDKTPTFALPQVIATASTGATATGGMIFFVFFWIFNKCTILNGKKEKICNAYIRKKHSVYYIKLPTKMNERYSSKLQIVLKKNFVKANNGKPLNIMVNGVIHQKNVTENIIIYI